MRMYKYSKRNGVCHLCNHWIEDCDTAFIAVATYVMQKLWTSLIPEPPFRRSERITYSYSKGHYIGPHGFNFQSSTVNCIDIKKKWRILKRTTSSNNWHALLSRDCFSIPDNPLNTKLILLYLKTQFVPRRKHFSSRLWKPISLCCKWHKSPFVIR